MSKTLTYQETEDWETVERMLEYYQPVEKGDISQQEIDYLGNLPETTELADDEKALEIYYRLLKAGGRNKDMTLDELREANQPEDRKTIYHHKA